MQFAAKMGCRTVAIARGSDKEPLARKLGAHHYIDNSTQDVASALGKLGGVPVILATVPSSNAMSAPIGGLAVGGKLVVLGPSPEPIEVSPLKLISDQRAIQGVAFLHLHQFRGHAGIQRDDRHPANDRNHAPGTRTRSI